MNLEDLERRIKSIARRYANMPSEIEDLEQIGRITVWQELEKDPDKPASYYLKAVENDFRNYHTHRKRRIRMPEGGLVSADTPFGAEDERTILDSVGTSDPKAHELTDALNKELKRLYGRYRIKGIKAESKPRLIVRNIVRGAIEDIADISVEVEPEKITEQLFRELGIHKIVWAFYNSLYDAVNDAFGNQFVPWQLSQVPRGYWQGKRGYRRAVKAVEWFLAEKEIASKQECRDIHAKEFREVGLGGMLTTVFGDSAHLALKTRFPELKPWEGIWVKGIGDPNQQKAALNSFLVNNGVQPLSDLTPEETYDQNLRTIVTKKALCDYGLPGVLKRHGGIYNMFLTLFPEQILPWTLAGSSSAWREEPRAIGTQAVRWLFDDYLEIETEDIPDYATRKLFDKVGFGSIITSKRVGFGSVYQAVNSAYPQKFSQKDFRKGRTTKDHEGGDFRRKRQPNAIHYDQTEQVSQNL
jgi:hypothetical protein